MRSRIMLGVMLVLFTCANFVRAQNVYRTGQVRVTSAYTGEYLHGIKDSYFILEKCKVYDCGYIVDKVFSSKMIELMSERKPDQEMYFLIDSNYTEAQLLIIPYSQVCNTHTWSGSKKLNVMYFIRYKDN